MTYPLPFSSGRGKVGRNSPYTPFAQKERTAICKLPSPFLILYLTACGCDRRCVHTLPTGKVEIWNYEYLKGIFSNGKAANAEWKFAHPDSRTENGARNQETEMEKRTR